VTGAPAPESLVFVCEVPEFVKIARATFRAIRPDISFAPVGSRAALLSLPEETLKRGRLVGFVTGVVVPAALLARLGFGAYNFHPGPPEYPGWDPIRFALYAGSLDFGVTAHGMAAEVDSGPIVGVRRCRAPERATYSDYQARMVEALMALLADLAPALAISAQGPPPLDVAWGARRFTRADAAALCRIAPDIAPAELDRRIAAFGSGEIALRPTIELHGRKFVYAQDELF
jgi:methionyl-tRNA formyltransferase